MAASVNDKISQVTSSNTGRPVVTTLSGAGHSIAGTSVTIAAATNWPTTTGIHFSIYETTTVGGATVKDTSTQTDWKGTLASTTISNMTITGGTDRAYSAGAIVEITPTARWAKDLYDWGIAQHNQDGTHSAITATSITATTGTFTNLTIAGTASAEGWSPLGAAPDTITANGNRSYDLVFNSNDLTDTLSPGMRVKATRTVAAPTYIANLEASSSHYFNKTSPAGMTFTDDFVVSAWVKLESYPGADSYIVSRINGTQGWWFGITTAGQLVLSGHNAALGNYSRVFSYQSLPLNKWVHVSAQLDMSAFTATTTTSYVMIDGVNVPAYVVRAGTNPTALVQAGNLEVGSGNGGTGNFDGKIAQVAIYSAKVTQANVLATMAQGLTGSETSLISAYSFNNTINDLNTGNANNLTAQNSAVATATDTPFAGGSVGTTEYGIVTAATFSTNTTLTVQVPEGYALPTTGGISAVSYSINKIPYGFPLDASKWEVISLLGAGFSTTTTANTWVNPGSWQMSVPVGSWELILKATLNHSNTSASIYAPRGGLSTADNTVSDQDFYSDFVIRTSSTSASYASVWIAKKLTITTKTPYYAVIAPETGAGTITVGWSASIDVGDVSMAYIKAECAYL